MKKYDPLCVMSSICFEAKHKQLKRYVKATTSRVNPFYTCSHQLRLCHRFVNADRFSDRFQHDTKIFKFSDLFDYRHVKNVLHSEIIYDDNLDCVS